MLRSITSVLKRRPEGHKTIRLKLYPVLQDYFNNLISWNVISRDKWNRLTQYGDINDKVNIINAFTAFGNVRLESTETRIIVEITARGKRSFTDADLTGVRRIVESITDKTFQGYVLRFYIIDTILC